MNTITVIIPTYNPDANIFARTLNNLKAQSYPKTHWNLIIIDSASDYEIPCQNTVKELSATIFRENMAGLTRARIRGVNEASGEILIFIDDDNFIDKDYLLNSHKFLSEHPNVSCLGGKIEALYEVQPPKWIKFFENNLAIRDYGNNELISNPAKWYEYPPFAPVGAGMVIRKEAALLYIAENKNNINIADRTKDNASSAGDCDINLTIMKNGYSVAYSPSLKLMHFIPRKRLTIKYQSKLAHGITCSWVKVLAKHYIVPWPPIHPHTRNLRKIKNFFTNLAFFNIENYLNWRSNCGYIDGRAEIYSQLVASPQLTLGKIVYHLFHKPLNKLKKIIKTGVFNYLKTEKSRKEMYQKSWAINKVKLTNNKAHGFHILTGKDYLDETIWLLKSLTSFCYDFPITIYDDGTLNSTSISKLTKIYEGIKLIPRAEIEFRLEKNLPLKDFPTLRTHRLAYPHLKKLTDIHSVNPGWKLVLDSDQLFFNKPNELIEWLTTPRSILSLKEKTTTYGYDSKILSAITGKDLIENINVGVIGINSEMINWIKLEEITKYLLNNHGSRYCLEQGLSAIVASLNIHEFLPDSLYQVNPDQVPELGERIIMQHYISESKKLYYQEAWRKWQR